MATLGLVLLLSFASPSPWLCADQVEMQNGDRYVGKVLSLTTNQLVIQSDVLGKLTLTRDKVALITLGPTTKTNVIRAASSTSAQANPSSDASAHLNPDAATALRSVGSNTNLAQQVREQFLAGAGAEANKKFDELLSGLASGKLNLDGIRSEATSAASQLRALKKELGPDASEPLDAYLEILDNFLKEAAPPAGAVPGAAAAQPGAKP
jgi:hypothetical protein